MPSHLQQLSLPGTLSTSLSTLHQRITSSSEPSLISQAETEVSSVFPKTPEEPQQGGLCSEYALHMQQHTLLHRNHRVAADLSHYTLSQAVAPTTSDAYKTLLLPHHMELATNGAPVPHGCLRVRIWGLVEGSPADWKTTE